MLCHRGGVERLRLRLRLSRRKRLRRLGERRCDGGRQEGLHLVSLGYLLFLLHRCGRQNWLRDGQRLDALIITTTTLHYVFDGFLGPYRCRGLFHGLHGSHRGRIESRNRIHWVCGNTLRTIWFRLLLRLYNTRGCCFGRRHTTRRMRYSRRQEGRSPIGVTRNVLRCDGRRLRL